MEEVEEKFTSDREQVVAAKDGTTFYKKVSRDLWTPPRLAYCDGLQFHRVTPANQSQSSAEVTIIQELENDASQHHLHKIIIQ